MNQIFKKHEDLFKSKSNQFNEQISMLISFRNEKDILNLKQISYNMFARNRTIVEEILDSLIKNDQIQKISLKMISTTFSSTFVIWKNKKSRVMINLRRINTCFFSNVYSLSKQNTILNIMKEIEIFLSIDMTKNFFQQLMSTKDLWNIIFVIQHTNLKWLTIFNMRLKNTFKFFQTRMKKIFDFYLWKFVLIYMHNIIVFFRTSKEHLHHFDEILILLENSEVTLSLKKCHFAFLSIKILKHHVFRLNLNTIEKKTKTINNFKFSRSLKKLEIKLKIFDYYRKFVSWYATIEKSLLDLKIQDFKNNLLKKNFRIQWTLNTKFRIEKSFKLEKRYLKSLFECVQTWEQLKSTLISTFTLTFSDFKRSFILYVDDSKEQDYEVTLHQKNKNKEKKSILFLSRSLSLIEIKYWSIELKINVLIWIFIKLFQYFDDKSFKMIIDYFVLKTTLQIQNTKRRFNKFNEWFMFLSKFLSRKNIMHKIKISHQNANELFKLLFSLNKNKKEFFLFVTIILNNEDLLKKIAKNL